MNWLKKLLGLALTDEAPDALRMQGAEQTGAKSHAATGRTIRWDSVGAPSDGVAFFEALRPCLPEVFAEVMRVGRDPIVVFANLEQMRWRGLLRLMLDKPSAIYFSPEQLTGQPIRTESTGGVALYQAPVLDGNTLRVGVYAAEREQAIYALCGIQGIPMPLIKMVKAQPDAEMFTVAYFGFSQFGVRLVSRDAAVCETPFPF